jgi:putative transposase
MVKAHEIKLYPTKSQEIFFNKSCGVARFAFNWALNKWQEDYKNGVKQSAYSLIKYLNSIKKQDFPWMQDTGKTCSQYAIHNVEAAYKKMWKQKTGYPKFKKKGAKESFVAVENHQSFKQKDFKIKIPRLGYVKCGEMLRFDGKVNNVTVKRVSNMWFAVININIEDNPNKSEVICENQTIIGIDMGIKSLMVLSDGTIFENPKALKINLKSLKRLQRGFSRKIKGSNNSKKQQIKISRKHYRISCIRKNAIHKATSFIVNKYDKIVIETLMPKNMAKNHKIAQAINDVSFGEIARQLTYKCSWNGKELVKADRWFASSKICSCCGNKKQDLKLSERIYKCNNCGAEINRDLNAAKNLANYSPTSKYEES